MSTADETHAEQIETLEQRPLFAFCSGLLVAAEQPADKPKTNGGRWRLNAGSEMVLRVWGINMKPGPWGPQPAPIRCVIDLATATFDKPKIRAFVEHFESMRAVAGWWTDHAVSKSGIEASLTWFEPKTEAAQKAAEWAVLARELIASGDPMEASVGAVPRDGIAGYRLIAAGDSIELNGRTYKGEGEYPLYVLANAVIHESSFCLWGADRGTGQIAARAHLRNPKEPTVSTATPPPAATPAPSIACDRIKGLATKHAAACSRVLLAIIAGLAANQTDAELDAGVKAAELEEENAKLKAQLEQQAQKPAATPAPTPAAVKAGKQSSTPPGAGTREDEADVPANLAAACKVLQAEGSKLQGAKLISEAYRRWPALEAKRGKA